MFWLCAVRLANYGIHELLESCQIFYTPGPTYLNMYLTRISTIGIYWTYIACPVTYKCIVVSQIFNYFSHLSYFCFVI